MYKIIYNDKEYEYNDSITILEFIKGLNEEFKEPIIVGSIDNKLCSLNTIISKDCTIKLYDKLSVNGNRVYKRGFYMLLSKAVRDILNCDIKIMYVLGGAIYCEILSNKIISEASLEKIKIHMDEMIKSSLSIDKMVVSRLESIEYYNNINQLDKAKSLKYISNGRCARFLLWYITYKY